MSFLNSFIKSTAFLKKNLLPKLAIDFVMWYVLQIFECNMLWDSPQVENEYLKDISLNFKS